MNKSPAPKDPLADCFHNGKHTALEVSQAHQLFYEVEFAWCVPGDLYRYNLDGHADTFLVHRRLRNTLRVMVYRLHQRGYLGLTLGTLKELDSLFSEGLVRASFRARMCRINTSLFRDLPDKLWPFEVLDGLRGDDTAGYVLKRERDMLLVDGAVLRSDPTIRVDDALVDWTVFHRPPQA